MFFASFLHKNIDLDASITTKFAHEVSEFLLEAKDELACLLILESVQVIS